LLVRRRAAHDGEDDAEPRARDAEAHEDFENLVLAGRDGEGPRQHQPGGIEQRAQHDRAPVAEPFGDGAEDRLADAPGEVLDRDGEAEFGRSQPNSSAIGIWNRPKLDRIAMLRRSMREPPIRTGVRREVAAP
jgi:hypothetical protein